MRIIEHRRAERVLFLEIVERRVARAADHAPSEEYHRPRSVPGDRGEPAARLVDALERRRASGFLARHRASNFYCLVARTRGSDAARIGRR